LTKQIFELPSHPYTRHLMSSLPRVPARIEDSSSKAHSAAAGVTPTRSSSHCLPRWLR